VTQRHVKTFATNYGRT